MKNKFFACPFKLGSQLGQPDAKGQETDVEEQWAPSTQIPIAQF